jgi:hypothetical protein
MTNKAKQKTKMSRSDSGATQKPPFSYPRVKKTVLFRFTETDSAWLSGVYLGKHEARAVHNNRFRSFYYVDVAAEGWAFEHECVIKGRINSWLLNERYDKKQERIRRSQKTYYRRRFTSFTDALIALLNKVTCGGLDYHADKILYKLFGRDEGAYDGRRLEEACPSRGTMRGEYSAREEFFDFKVSPGGSER